MPWKSNEPMHFILYMSPMTKNFVPFWPMVSGLRANPSLWLVVVLVILYDRPRGWRPVKTISGAPATRHSFWDMAASLILEKLIEWCQHIKCQKYYKLYLYSYSKYNRTFTYYYLHCMDRHIISFKIRPFIGHKLRPRPVTVFEQVQRGDMPFCAEPWRFWFCTYLAGTSFWTLSTRTRTHCWHTL